MRFWQRFDVQCAYLITHTGDELKWVGVYTSLVHQDSNAVAFLSCIYSI